MTDSPAAKPFSIRMSEHTLARLGERARRRNEAKARVAERLIDEGLRMEDHPGIVFRDGPTGRRAALAAGPDVWEVIETLGGTGLTGERAIAATAEWGNLTPVQVHATVGYYSEYRDEVDERIALNREEAKHGRPRGSGRRKRLLEATSRRDVPNRNRRLAAAWRSLC